VHHQSHRNFRPALLAVFTGAVLALAVAAPAALAGPTSDPTAPVFPSAVPSQPGSLTGTQSKIAASTAPVFPSAVPSRPGSLTGTQSTGHDGGTAWWTIGFSVLAGVLGAGGAATRTMRTRRRTVRAHVAA
jgi:hypothetical protein